jgi:hypothetical protein
VKTDPWPLTDAEGAEEYKTTATAAVRLRRQCDRDPEKVENRIATMAVRPTNAKLVGNLQLNPAGSRDYDQSGQFDKTAMISIQPKLRPEFGR